VIVRRLYRGAGTVVLSGLTMPRFHTPAHEANLFRRNIFAFLRDYSEARPLRLRAIQYLHHVHESFRTQTQLSQ